jgi:hypothetical protein
VGPGGWHVVVRVVIGGRHRRFCISSVVVQVVVAVVVPVLGILGILV